MNNNTADIANDLISGDYDNFRIIAYVFFSIITASLTIVEATLLKMLKGQSNEKDIEKGTKSDFNDEVNDEDSDQIDVIDIRLKKQKSMKTITKDSNIESDTDVGDADKSDGVDKPETIDEEDDSSKKNEKNMTQT